MTNSKREAIDKSARRNLLRRLIELSSPVSELRPSLMDLEWDSPIDVVFINRSDIVAVLQRYIDGNLTDQEIEEWANMIESREDVGFEKECETLLKEVTFALANPGMTNPISQTSAREWLRKIAAS